MLFRNRGEVEALQQTIKLLIEERDWLRMSLGTPTPRASLLPSSIDAPLEGVTFQSTYVNEDEEDVKDMLEAGLITKEDIPEVLDALGFSNTDIHIA